MNDSNIIKCRHCGTEYEVTPKVRAQHEAREYSFYCTSCKTSFYYNKMYEKQFHISDILSITTGRLLSTRHMDGIYDILDFLSQDELYTHQLPRAMKEFQPYLLEQFPQFVDIDKDLTQENCGVWLQKQTVKFGEMFVVTISFEDIKRLHSYNNPLDELITMVGNRNNTGATNE
jgi:hypothetical protein